MIALAVCIFANAQKEIPDSARELLFDKIGALTRVTATEDEVAAKIISQNPLLDDVPWRKVVLRVIDLREEQNKPLYYPYENISEDSQKNLFAILFYNFLTGKLVGYKSQDPQAAPEDVPLFIEENEVRASDSSFIKYSIEPYFKAENYNDDAEISPSDTSYIKGLEDYLNDYYGRINQITQSCIQYYIQEAWYFDKHTSTFHSKILAIAPSLSIYYNKHLFESYKEEVKPAGIWFWFPYDKVRPFLQEEYIKMSGKNTKQLLNFDDFFTQRQFYSYIVRDFDLKERIIDKSLKMNDDDPNYVIKIKEEQDRVEAEILDFEQDLWNY